MKKSPKYKFIINVYNHLYSIRVTYEITASCKDAAIRRAKKAFKNVLGVNPKEPIIINCNEVIIDSKQKIEEMRNS